MNRIETATDWWKLLHQHEDDLASIVSQYHPAQRQPSGMPITAQGAEMACEIVRAEIAVEQAHLGHPFGRFRDAVKKKDWKELLSLLNGAWFGVPESMGAWAIPSFGVLCDLCSESWVFQEEEEAAS